MASNMAGTRRYADLQEIGKAGDSPGPSTKLVLARTVLCGSSVCRGTQPRQTREERGQLERHFVASGSVRDRRRFNHLDAIIPRVELDASAKRQSGYLIQLRLVEAWR